MSTPPDTLTPDHRLFKVNATYHLVIRAATAEAAEKLAHGIVRNELNFEDTPSNVTSEELKSVDELEEPWEPDCRPWGETDPFDRTIEEILAPVPPTAASRTIGPEMLDDGAVYWVRLLTLPDREWEPAKWTNSLFHLIGTTGAFTLAQVEVGEQIRRPS